MYHHEKGATDFLALVIPAAMIAGAIVLASAWLGHSHHIPNRRAAQRVHTSHAVRSARSVPGVGAGARTTVTIKAK